MREIDPQSETRLTEALRRLAAASPQAAPPEIGAGLLGEFRRHHVRRRRIRRARNTLLALALIMIAVAVAMRQPGPQHGRDTAGRRQAEKAVVAQAPTQIRKPASVAGSRGPRPKAQDKQRPLRTTLAGANQPFLALPGYDPTVPLDQLHVVRVQLPASELWQIGAPVSASAGDRRMTADFVISQGGTPYAVRLVP